MRVENMISYAFRTMVPDYGPGEVNAQLNPRWGYYADNTNYVFEDYALTSGLSWRRWQTNPAWLPQY